MAASGGADGLLDMEKELTCSICTDILYQPLTLLDCLHTFCGSCLKEWFAFQATAAARTKSPRNATPYTCPSCREHVRGTRVDWRSTALLEGFLRANPDREKSTEEKEVMKERYQPGDDVIPKVELRRDDTDSEDERLMEEVRELSVGQVDPEAARRRAERRAERAARYRREEGRRHTQAASRSGHLPLSEDRLREHNANESQIEHQPSLRSLLSNASPVDSHDVQQDILQSIYSEGLLDGVDLDNLTTEQEEELTERIAEAYRRRQRRRDRPRNRGRSHRTSHSQDPPASAGADTQGRHHSRTNSASLQAPRIRPPISRPHLFEQHENSTDRQIRSASATSRRSQRSASRGDALAPASQDSRSATDLSENSGTENAERERRQRLSSNTTQFATQGSRGSGPRTHISHMRASSHDRRSTAVPPQAQGPLEALRRQGAATNNSTPSLIFGTTTAGARTEHEIRQVASNAAFAPEHITSATPVPEPSANSTNNMQRTVAPMIRCSRCEKQHIEYDLHYHCPWCRSGKFELCFQCYRAGQGCDHWYGFGYMACERWHRLAPPEGWPQAHGRPHVLDPRRWIRDAGMAERLQEGAFCESCLVFADECYWYCPHCLEGAWGYCDRCVQQGNCCTHPLLPVAHHSTRGDIPYPTKPDFVQLPNLRQDSYVLLPISTDCDLCHRPIPPNSTRFHCYQCSHGDYDICTECYHGLAATGKLSQANGPNGWRRCLQGHRMAIIGYQDSPGVGHHRLVLRDQVGGRRYKDVPGETVMAPPSDDSLGGRSLSLWSFWPGEEVTDELAVPKNAEVTEVEEKHADWHVGVYGGKVGLFPSSYVRRI